MRYWKGLAVAAAIDLACIAGCPAIPTDPAPPATIEAVAADDVDAMEHLARVYTERGCYEAALAPLARALQLAPSRRSLWVALDGAVEKSGRVKITDAELTRKAQDFVAAVEMWGMDAERAAK